MQRRSTISSGRTSRPVRITFPIKLLLAIGMTLSLCSSVAPAGQQSAAPMFVIGQPNPTTTILLNPATGGINLAIAPAGHGLITPQQPLLILPSAGAAAILIQPNAPTSNSVIILAGRR